MAIFMQIEGIDGTVTAKGHEKWIDCSSMQWGVGRAISNSVGTMDDREASKPSISEISITKQMDLSSTALFTEATIGKGKKVVIHLCKTGSDEIETYQEYELEDCMVSGYSVSSGGDRPQESISLSFSKILCTYTPFTPDGKAGSPNKSGYDVAAGTKV